MPHVHFRHETLLLRQLKDVDMKWQLNKVQNLKIASRKVDGVVERPGQPFSYWKLVRRPTYKKVTSTV
jgi:vancomycin resistance protein VanW